MKPYVNKHVILSALLTLLMLALFQRINTDAFNLEYDQQVGTFSLTPITFEERCIDDAGAVMACHQLQKVETGDILVTKSSHTLFFRHGHVGVVVDATEGLVLEAQGYGHQSTLKPLSKWAYYPTVKILRLKDATPQLIEHITSLAMEEFLDIPYSILARGTSRERTHCSALIWKIFYEVGIDLSGDRWPILPRTIANSPYLQVMESHGFMSDNSW